MAYRNFRSEDYYKAPEIERFGLLQHVIDAEAQRKANEDANKAKEVKERTKLDKEMSNDAQKLKSTSWIPKENEEVSKGIGNVVEYASSGSADPSVLATMMNDVNSQNQHAQAAEKVWTDGASQINSDNDPFLDKGRRLKDWNDAQYKEDSKEALLYMQSKREESLLPYFKATEYTQSFTKAYDNSYTQELQSQTAKDQGKFIAINNETAKLGARFTIPSDKQLVIKGEKQFDDAGNPVMARVVGVSDDVVDNYIDPSTKHGALMKQTIAQEVSDKDIDKVLSEKQIPISDEAKIMVREQLIKEKAKAKLEGLNKISIALSNKESKQETTSSKASAGADAKNSFTSSVYDKPVLSFTNYAGKDGVQRQRTNMAFSTVNIASKGAKPVSAIVRADDSESIVISMNGNKNKRIGETTYRIISSEYHPVNKYGSKISATGEKGDEESVVKDLKATGWNGKVKKMWVGSYLDDKKIRAAVEAGDNSAIAFSKLSATEQQDLVMKEEDVYGKYLQKVYINASPALEKSIMNQLSKDGKGEYINNDNTARVAAESSAKSKFPTGVNTPAVKRNPAAIKTTTKTTPKMADKVNKEPVEAGEYTSTKGVPFKVK